MFKFIFKTKLNILKIYQNKVKIYKSRLSKNSLFIVIPLDYGRQHIHNHTRSCRNKGGDIA